MKNTIISNYRGKIRNTNIDLNRYIRAEHSGIYEINIPVNNTSVLNLPPNDISFSNNEYIGLTPESFLRLYRNKGSDIQVENDLIKFTGKPSDESNFLTGVLEVISDGKLTIQKFHRLPDGSLWQRTFDELNSRWTDWATEIPSYVKSNSVFDTRQRDGNDPEMENNGKDSNINIENYYVDFYDGKNKKVNRNNYMGAYRGINGENINKYNSFNMYHKLNGTMTDLEVVDYIDYLIRKSEDIGGVCRPTDSPGAGETNGIYLNRVGFKNYNYITKDEFNNKVQNLFKSTVSGESEEETVKRNKRLLLLNKYRLKSNLPLLNRPYSDSDIYLDTNFIADNIFITKSDSSKFSITGYRLNLDDNFNYSEYSTYGNRIRFEDQNYSMPAYMNQNNQDYKYNKVVSKIHQSYDREKYWGFNKKLIHDTGAFTLETGTFHIFGNKPEDTTLPLKSNIVVCAREFPFLYRYVANSGKTNIVGQLVGINQKFFGKSLGINTFTQGLPRDNNYYSNYQYGYYPVQPVSEKPINTYWEIPYSGSPRDLEPLVVSNGENKKRNVKQLYFLKDFINEIKITIYFKVFMSKDINNSNMGSGMYMGSQNTRVEYYTITDCIEHFIPYGEYTSGDGIFVPVPCFGTRVSIETGEIEFGGFTYIYDSRGGKAYLKITDIKVFTDEDKYNSKNYDRQIKYNVYSKFDSNYYSSSSGSTPKVLSSDLKGNTKEAYAEIKDRKYMIDFEVSVL